MLGREVGKSRGLALQGNRNEAAPRLAAFVAVRARHADADRDFGLEGPVRRAESVRPRARPARPRSLRADRQGPRQRRPCAVRVGQGHTLPGGATARRAAEARDPPAGSRADNRRTIRLVHAGASATDKSPSRRTVIQEQPLDSVELGRVTTATRARPARTSLQTPASRRPASRRLVHDDEARVEESERAIEEWRGPVSGARPSLRAARCLAQRRELLRVARQPAASTRTRTSAARAREDVLAAYRVVTVEPCESGDPPLDSVAGVAAGAGPGARSTSYP